METNNQEAILRRIRGSRIQLIGNECYQERLLSQGLLKE